MSAPAAGPDEGSIAVGADRLQAIGVRFARAELQALNREIRTTGRVEIDERKLARVNLKIEGWIDRLHVNTTGEQVRAGQTLFELYSPDLVAAQEEYLLALRGAARLESSDYPEVSGGATSLLAAARRRLLLWDIAEDDLRNLERTGSVRKSLPIRAPLSGTVIEKMAIAGMRVEPGSDLYVIADLGRVWVIADIYEYELPLVQVGQTALITLPYGGHEALTAKLTFIYPTLERETRTARVRFELDNPAGRLKPAMFVNVALAVPLGRRLFVPRDAVLETGTRRIVFIRRDGGRLVWRHVEIGVRAGDQLEILSGVNAGEEIVTSANFLLDSESQVRSAMAGMPGMDMSGAEPARAPAAAPGRTGH